MYTSSVVYVAAAPPSMHDLMKQKKAATGADAVKRPLSEFETAAVAKLRDGEDVVLEVSADAMHAVGAIRARTECISCHKTAEVGTLLGAFTYTLALQSEATPAADRLGNLEGLTDQERAAVEAIESIGGKVHRDGNGPVTKIELAHSRNAEIAAKKAWPATTRLQARNSSLTLLGAFPNLTALDISQTLISDDGIDQIAGLLKLKTLNIADSHLTADGIATLKKKLPGCDVNGQSALTRPVTP